MGQLVGRMMCSECGGFRRATAWGANHLLHLVIVALLALLTKATPDPFGLFTGLLVVIWISVWISASLIQDWHCADCGIKLKGRDTLKLRRAERVAEAQEKRSAKVSSGLERNPGFTPPRPSALHESARAEWDAKYGGR